MFKTIQIHISRILFICGFFSFISCGLSISDNNGSESLKPNLGKKLISNGNEFISLGDQFFDEDRYQEALKCYKEAYDVLDDSDEYLGNLCSKMGVCLFSAKEFKKSLDLFNRVDDDNNLYYIGSCYYELGDFKSALDCYNRFIKINPRYYYANHDKASTLERLGRYEEALVSYDKAILIDSGKAENVAYAGKAGVLYRLKRYEEALKFYDKDLHYNPNNVKSFLCKSNLLLDMMRFKESILYFDEFIKSHPNIPNTDVSCGLIIYSSALTSIGQYEKSLVSINKAIELDPKRFSALYNKAKVLFELRRLDEAFDFCKKYLNIDPKHQLALELMNKIKQEMNK